MRCKVDFVFKNITDALCALSATFVYVVTSLLTKDTDEILRLRETIFSYRVGTDTKTGRVDRLLFSKDK